MSLRLGEKKNTIQYKEQRLFRIAADVLIDSSYRAVTFQQSPHVPFDLQIERDAVLVHERSKKDQRFAQVAQQFQCDNAAQVVWIVVQCLPEQRDVQQQLVEEVAHHGQGHQQQHEEVRQRAWW